MKNLILILFVLLVNYANAQQSPAVVFSKCIGGDGSESIAEKKVSIGDNGDITFILKTNSEQGTGNIQSCLDYTGFPPLVSQTAFIFQTYDSSGTILKSSICRKSDSIVYRYCDQLPGGRLLTGYRYINNLKYQVYVAHEDMQGNVTWEKNYGGSNDDLFEDRIRTSDNHLIIAAYSNSADGDVGVHYGSTDTSDMWLFKIDTAGNVLWSTVIGGTDRDMPYRLVSDAYGGCYVVGETSSNDYDCNNFHGGIDILIARIDSNGNKKWTKSLGGSYNDLMRGACCADGNGGLIASFMTSSQDGDVVNPTGGMIDIWLVNLDSMGNKVWSKFYKADKGFFAKVYINALAKSTDGSIWIGGSSDRASDKQYVPNNYGNSDAYLMHLDENGNYLEAKIMGTKQSDGITMLHPLAGGIMLAGGDFGGVNDVGSDLPLEWYGGYHDIFLTAIAPWSTSVSAMQANSASSLHPNPATGLVIVRFIELPFDVTVCDIAGWVQYEGKSSSSNLAINVADWKKGVYIVRLAGSNGAQKVTKLLVQ